MRLEQSKVSFRLLEQLAERGVILTGAAAMVVVVELVVVSEAPVSSPPNRELNAQASSATTATAARITASALAPADVLIIG